MSKLLFVIFTENSSIGASVLCNMAIEKYGWDADIFYVPQNEGADNLLAYIDEYAPDLIAFSIKSFERNQAIQVAGEVAAATSIPLVAGGVHPTLLPDDILSTGHFKAVVIGDGMGAMGEVLANYKSYIHTKVAGSEYPDKTMYTRLYHSTSQVERMINSQTAAVLTAVGCPFKCTFCHSGAEKFQVLPIESVVKYVVYLYETYHVRCFHFVDDLFASNVNRLRKFQRLIAEAIPDFKISSQVSAKPSTLTLEIAKELVNLGVETVNLGIETSSPKMLEFLNKSQTVDDCYNVVDVCDQAGLNCVINLMYGIPTQTEEDYIDTLNYVKKAKPDSITTFFFAPYPGTVLYDYCFDNGFTPPEYDRNRFDWFNAEADGISEVQVRLNNVDYDLARSYVKQTKAAMDQDGYLFERVAVLDEKPWVLVGSTRHYYFKLLMRKLSELNLKNCLGYINLDENIGFPIDPAVDGNITEYSGEAGRPDWCATYAFLGADFQIMSAKMKDHFDVSPPLISISSFKRSHTVENIRAFSKDVA